MTPHTSMRRGERELSPTEAEALLRRGDYGILSTCGESGEPYGIPLCYVFDGNSIAFHSATEGHKLRLLQQNPRVCFTVVGTHECLPSRFSMRYESAMAFGHVTQAEGEHKKVLLRALVEKYSPDFQDKGEIYIRHDADNTAVFELHISRLSGKAHR